MTDYLEQLNPVQREAVEQIDGPILILAGAGSGKTRVITSRIIHMIEQHDISPYRILAMTFTNKAAQEMRNRIEDSLQRGSTELTISTFHSFCARFLRREIEFLDRDTNFVIYDSSDQQACMKRVIKALDLNEKVFPPAALRNHFSNIKNKGDWDARPEDPKEALIFEHYQEELRINNALDFDDLILLTCKIMHLFEPCRERYQRRFAYIMVDEYQDTNRAQFKLIQSLAGSNPNLCVVGDEDQSIYGWRGADIRNILDFEADHPDARTFKLEQNYRSSQSILDFANRVIAKNQMRKPKKLWTAAGPGEPIQTRTQRDSVQESEFIAAKIMQIHSQEKVDLRHFAVLFRSNYLSRNLEDVFRRARIPYQLIGGLKFYDRKEIKDLIAYMRIAVNPRDWTSFCRAVAAPPKGIGAKSLDQMSRIFYETENIPEMLSRVTESKLLRGRAHKAVAQFGETYKHFNELAQTKKPTEWLQALIEKLDYYDYLQRLDQGTPESRIANVTELLTSIQEMGVQSLAEFMDHSALISDQDQMEDKDRVNLMTIHAAKGLEFDTVFVMAMEENIFPNQRALHDNEHGLEEERRLFYVAATRAQKRLFLTRARRRQSFGSFSDNFPSRFLKHAAIEPAPVKNHRKATKISDIESQLTRMQQQLEQRNVSVDFGAIGKKAFKVGDTVKHPKFGIGRVVKLTGRGSATRIAVYFSGKGTKLFKADRTPLQHANR